MHEGEPAEVGGVWLIASVEASRSATPLKLSNRFEAALDEVQEVCATEASSEQQCGTMFHLTDPKRMLASVDKLTAAGNEVKFGPMPADNYVMNLKTGKNI